MTNSEPDVPLGEEEPDFAEEHTKPTYEDEHTDRPDTGPDESVPEGPGNEDAEPPLL